MDPALVKQLLLGVVPPLVLGVIVFGLLWWKRQNDLSLAPRSAAVGDHRKPHEFDQTGDTEVHAASTQSFSTGAAREPGWHGLVMLLCAAACFLGVYPLVFGKFQPWPGTSADGSLFWCALIALAAGLLWCFVHNAWARGTVVALALGACSWLSFRRQLFDSWSAAESLATLALLIAGGGLFAISLARLGERGRIAGVIGSVAAVALAAQVLVVCLASLKHAQGAGTFASFLTFAMVMILLRPTRALSGPMLAMIGIVLATQLVQLVRFGDGKFPWLMAGLVLSGPALGLLAMRLFRRGGLASVLIPILATVLPGLAAVGTGAYLSLQADKASGAADYEY
jgi:hypothetical protein